MRTRRVFPPILFGPAEASNRAVMEGLQKIFGEKRFRDMMSITNPMYPLHFERFGDGDLEEDEEFRAHVRKLYVAGHPVKCEIGSSEEFYENRQLYEAEAMARMAYAAQNPVAEARKALDVSPDSPEAFNVLAQFGSNSYEEALGKIKINIER